MIWEFAMTFKKKFLYFLTLVITAYGCKTIYYYVVRHNKGITFSHKKHLQEGLECEVCHSNYAKESTAGMPSFDDCNNCHSDIDKTKPEERRIVNFLIDGKPAWSSVTKLSDELKFSHKVHYDAKVSCESCHKNIRESEAVSSELALSMSDCISCHNTREKELNKQVLTECSTCHRSITKNTKPSSHNKGWEKFHGQVAKIGGMNGSDTKTQNQCSLCHSEETCTKCHQDNPPESHNNFWRHKGHGVSARIDRKSCAVCHKTDFCQRCHEETAPLNHVGLWGGFGKAANTHCLSCHFPLNSQLQNCYVCHKSTPGHMSAPNKPGTPVHNTQNSADCRFCHSASLPHRDNPAVDCSNCHR